MTAEERLAKNNRIRDKGKETREKRKRQVCRVYRVKIDVSHLSEQQKTQLKMLFVEAKWLYNDALTFIAEHNINDYDYKIRHVKGLDKNRQPVTREIMYLSSQMRQSVIAGIRQNLKSLLSLKNNHRKTGKLHYKSDYTSINLQQHNVTYKFYDMRYIRLQGFKRRIRIRGAGQFWNIPGIELANAKLLNLPDGYYLAITTYQTKINYEQYKPKIGIDMGIKTSITTSDGQKIKVLIEETKRLKKCQKKLARKKKDSSNRYKARKLLRKEYQRLTSKKRDAANKIVHELLRHEKIYMQDENIKSWHKGLFGRIVQHSILGLVKSKLIKNEHVVVLSSREPTTKYCPVCKRINGNIRLSDRKYKCECGYEEDRDINAARNMILLGEKHTCGTQGINAFGEDVRRYESQDDYCSLDELGSSRFYKRR